MPFRVLVVDDEKDICEVVKTALENEGYEVETSFGGAEAIQCLEKGDHQILMVDARLEGRVSGIDVIRFCKDIVKKPRIFIISATIKEVLHSVLKREGLTDLVEGILEKPADLRPDVIAERIQ